MQTVQQLEIPEDILEAAGMSIHDMQVELAISLYAQGRLSFGKARELANLSLWEFRQLLAARHIPPQYDENDLHSDVATLKELGQL